uniref:Transmembrane protein n=1 Tax=Macrostomum lignano TaxID=282301 RepID=A0A1I8FM20_9PLAT
MEPAQLLINGLNSRESEPGLQQSAGAGVDQPLLGNRTSMTRLTTGLARTARDFIQTDEPAAAPAAAAGLAGNAATSSAALSSPRRRRRRPNSDPLPHKPSDLTLLQQFDELATRAKDSAEQFMPHVTTTSWCRATGLSLNTFLPPALKASFVFTRRLVTSGRHTCWLHRVLRHRPCTFSLGRLLRSNGRRKVVFAASFFLGAVLCMGFSFIFHTVYCHSERVGRLFNKLDYCGIALLTMGSFVPWLYYSFYCQLSPKIIYLSLISVLGTTAIVVSMFDKFAAPQYRPLRAVACLSLWLVWRDPPHCTTLSWRDFIALFITPLWAGWVLMALPAAVIYAVRFPEAACFPGNSISGYFHVFVVAARIRSFSRHLRDCHNYRPDCCATASLERPGDND